MSQMFRKFVVNSVIAESESAKSFYLSPEDAASWLPYRPGQYLQVKIQIPGQDVPALRSYTISGYSAAPSYRLTIQRERSRTAVHDIPGLVSNHLHNAISPGSVLECKPPTGDFFLDVQEQHPVVMLAGGIGITPMMSMLEAAAALNLPRPIHLFYSVRDGSQHAFKQELKTIATQHNNIRVTTLYSRPQAQDRLGADYDLRGRIELNRIQPASRSRETEYYTCGPSGMIEQFIADLKQIGIPEEKIRTEWFGKSGDVPEIPSASNDENSWKADLFVNFQRSGKTVKWENAAHSLLQLAEASGVDISSGCLYGDCGTCLTLLLDGRVKYYHATGVQPEPGTCLPCSCRPETSVILDA